MMGMWKKMKRRGGFTITDLLIVAAVAAIAAAIGMPILNQSFEKGREKTDIANLTTACYEAQAALVTGKIPKGNGAYYFDIQSGVLMPAEEKSKVKPCGQGTSKQGYMLLPDCPDEVYYNCTLDTKGKRIRVTVMDGKLEKYAVRFAVDE